MTIRNFKTRPAKAAAAFRRVGVNSFDLDLNTISCDISDMRFGESRLVRLMVALCVALSLAVMPILSQHAMAAHHVSDAKVSMDHSHDATAAKPCEKKQDSTADKDGQKCCDISCSSIAMVDPETTLSFGGYIFDHYQYDADELWSRVTFGLKRPPRV